MSEPLFVYLDGVRAGEVAQSRHGSLNFTYDAAYMVQQDPTPLSFSLPLRVEAHPNRPVRSFLEGLLPDNQAVRERWGSTYGVSANNPFALLRHVGRDAAGAVQVLPASEPSTDAQQQGEDIEWLTEADFRTLVRELAGHRRDWNPGRFAGRWSLAGAQSKAALFHDEVTGTWGIPRDATPTTRIVKPAIAGLDEHHVNEVLCQRTATALGLSAARTELIDLDDLRAIVSVRYDRYRDQGGRLHRLHQEDLCQALAVHPSQKYQADGGPGVGEIADLFARLDPEDRHISARRFFDGLVFNVLVGGTDAHAKNVSLLLRGRRAQLAPLYDLASAVDYFSDRPIESSMKIGEYRVMRLISSRDWGKAGRRLGLDSEEALARLVRLRDGLSTALDIAVDSLPAGAQARAAGLAERITAHAKVVSRNL